MSESFPCILIPWQFCAKQFCTYQFDKVKPSGPEAIQYFFYIFLNPNIFWIFGREEAVLWAEPNLLFLLWARHAENTREREMWSERLANNVIEIDPLLSGKYWTHKYELHTLRKYAEPILRKYFYASWDCCLSFDTGMSWFSSGGSLGTMFCVFCKLQVRTLRCCRYEVFVLKLCPN